MNWLSFSLFWGYWVLPLILLYYWTFSSSVHCTGPDCFSQNSHKNAMLLATISPRRGMATRCCVSDTQYVEEKYVANSHIRNHESVLVTSSVKLLAVLLAMVCLVTVAESHSVDRVPYYGRDSETITGMKSTREVFTRAGTYSLHDSTPRTPICSQCSQIEVQVDFGVSPDVLGPDSFNRIVETQQFMERSSSRGDEVILRVPQILHGEAVVPDDPPPRISTFA